LSTPYCVGTPPGKAYFRGGRRPVMPKNEATAVGFGLTRQIIDEDGRQLMLQIASTRKESHVIQTLMAVALSFILKVGSDRYNIAYFDLELGYRNAALVKKDDV
jgi:hypothetical protein